MRVSVRDVGPKDATRYLASQRRNRRLRPYHVKRLASAMARGEWRENGEGVKFDLDGRLCDGQHRLEAIVQSGVTLRMVVIEGLDEEAQETMDTGRHRSMADVLSLRGETNTAFLGSTLSTLHRIRTNTIQAQKGALSPTPQQLLKLLEEEPEIRRFLHRGRSVSERVPVTASLAAAYWYEFHRIDADDAHDFFTKLTSGIGLSDGDPIFALRRFLERERQSPRNLPRYRIAGVIVKAWNLYRHGATGIRALSFRAGGANAEEFPRIDGLPSDGNPTEHGRQETPRTKRAARSVAGTARRAQGAIVPMPARREAADAVGR